jgi:hypothetical protein
MLKRRMPGAADRSGPCVGPESNLMEAMKNKKASVGAKVR